MNADTSEAARPGWWRPLFEFGPVLVFLVILTLAGRLGLTDQAMGWFGLAAGQEGTARFLLATAVFVPLGLVGTLVLWFSEAKKPYMLLVGTLLVLIFGGLTLYFRDPVFLQLKVTLANLLFAVALGLGLLMRRLFLRDLLAEGMPFEVADAGWRQATWMWILFFVALALANEIARQVLSADAWAWLTKVGFLVLTLGASLGMVALLTRHKRESQDSA